MAISILPVAALFYVFSLVTHYYRLHEIKKMTVGFLYTYIGLVMFLTGVNFGFAPVGQSIGHVIAEGEYKWLLIPIGAIIGLLYSSGGTGGACAQQSGRRNHGRYRH